MPFRYLGIDIGQIQTLDLITARNEVQAKAVLYPEYVQTFARGGTRLSGGQRRIFGSLALSVSIRSSSRTSTLERRPGQSSPRL